MSDTKALEAQIESLTRAGFSLVESNRQLGSYVQIAISNSQEVGAKVGQLCDEMREYFRQNNERHRESEERHRGSESKIRALESRCDRFDKQIQSLAEAEAGRDGAARTG